MNPTVKPSSLFTTTHTTSPIALAFSGNRMLKQEGTVTARVRPTPPPSIPFSTPASDSRALFADTVWTIPPIPERNIFEIDNSKFKNAKQSINKTTMSSTCDPDNSPLLSPIDTTTDEEKALLLRGLQSENKISPTFPTHTSVFPLSPPSSLELWTTNFFRPVKTNDFSLSNSEAISNSAFQTPLPTLIPTVPIIRPLSVVRPSPQLQNKTDISFSHLPEILSPPQLTYQLDTSTPSTSTRSTTTSNIDGSDNDASSKPPFPPPPVVLNENVVDCNNDAISDPSFDASLEPYDLHLPPYPLCSQSQTVLARSMMKETPQSVQITGCSPERVSRMSNDSGNSVREAVLCNFCGQMHDRQSAHLYDYNESVDADLLCRICHQPLVDPLDTKCGHTFCTSCLKSHLVVQALCPEDKQIINYLECQQSSNLVKRLLDKLLVVCPNSEHCDEVLCRSDLDSHLNFWCRGTVVTCTNAKYGCQFRAARALQTEHGRECRFKVTKTDVSLSLEGSCHRSTSRKVNTKAVVRFGPMPTSHLDKSHSLVPNLSAAIISPFNAIPSNADNVLSQRSTIAEDKRFNPSIPSIPDCEVTTIELPWQPNDRLGISFVGGTDTPLLCIIVQEIYLDGIVAIDGRLRPGDQILEVNGVDLTQATHQQARMLLLETIPGRSYQMTVYREMACSESGSPSSKKPLPAMEDSLESEEILHITLMKRAEKRLGIKLVGKKNLPGLYILEVIPESEADLDGRLRKDDRILELNGVDLREGTQVEAANIIRTATENVVLVIARMVRNQSSPELLRIGPSNETNFSNNLAMIPSVKRTFLKPSDIEPPSLKPPQNRPCREQVLVVPKLPAESLGMIVAGGVSSQRGDTPVYVTDIDPNGVLGRLGQIAKGDVLLAVNEVELLGLSHDRAVEALKSTRNSCSKVTIRLLEGPETSLVKGNFLPSWLYWLQLPRYCQIPRTIMLSRSPSGSLGFSIVGGNNSFPKSDPLRTEFANVEHPRPSVTSSSSCVSSSPQPIVVKSIVPGTPAYRDGRLKCGDLILAVNQYSLIEVSHAHAVTLLKHCADEVHLRVVSWPGTIV